MDLKLFINLTYEQKTHYLKDLFFRVKDIFPIYRKMYDLLENEENLHEEKLNNIYNAVQNIKITTIEKKSNNSEKERKKKIRTIKEYESILKAKENLELLEIEKDFNW
jgi:Cdc6-like AAA superfamily ATPase